MKRKRILVVDDEVSFTRLLKLNLEQTGEYEVRAENRAEETVSVARGFRPDLILLDIMMPRMVGSDVAARLRADVHLNATPIVFLSAVAHPIGTSGHGQSDHAPRFISKPASVEDVLEGIEQELNRARPVATEDSFDGNCRSASGRGTAPAAGAHDQPAS